MASETSLHFAHRAKSPCRMQHGDSRVAYVRVDIYIYIYLLLFVSKLFWGIHAAWYVRSVSQSELHLSTMLTIEGRKTNIAFDGTAEPYFLLLWIEWMFYWMFLSLGCCAYLQRQERKAMDTKAAHFTELSRILCYKEETLTGAMAQVMIWNLLQSIVNTVLHSKSL